MKSSGNLKVVVRCRPLNAREISRGATCLVSMVGNQTNLEPPPVGSNDAADSGRERERRSHAFSFDKSYWSAGPQDGPQYASQQTLYEDIGVELVTHSLEGYHTCVFAYGQTGSGKSYTMMGYGAERGIIPLTTEELFNRIEGKTKGDANISYHVEVSYIEIYNEKVRDLLNPSTSGTNLRVREHPSLGPYVEDLTKLVVQDHDQLLAIMNFGNSTRTIAATAMNETSSRSHTIFSLAVTQTRRDPLTKLEAAKLSKISLVDLAGSERASKTSVEGARLKEGSNINKSLSTLGKVIQALSQASGTPRGKRKKDEHVPYRDSVLTWLLKESLGGNSKTCMVASISPADYEETLSTLRYANSAKRIRTHAIVNEDKDARLLRELLDEVKALRSKVATVESQTEPSAITYHAKDGSRRTITQDELHERIESSEKLIASLNMSWEQKLEHTKAIQSEREKAMEELGITLNPDLVGLHIPKSTAHIINLSDDPCMSECLLYMISSGITMVGSMDSTARIKLSGSGVFPEHCIFANTEEGITLTAFHADSTLVNGQPLVPGTPVRLSSGFRIIIDSHVFRFSPPADSLSSVPSFPSESDGSNSSPIQDQVYSGNRSGVLAPVLDWEYAQREAALHRLSGRPGFDGLQEHELSGIFDDLVVIKSTRSTPTSKRHSIGIAPGSSSEMKVDHSHSDTPVDIDSNPKGSPTHSRREMKITHATHRADSKDRQRSNEPALSPQQHFPLYKGSPNGRLVQFQRLTDSELSTVRPFANRWLKAFRPISTSERLLRMARTVKEANVIAKLAQQDISYDFVIQETGVSAREPSAGFHLFDSTAGLSISATKSPQLCIRVMDLGHSVAYNWDLAHFESQLNRMRRWREVQQSFGQHFTDQDIFNDFPSPSMTLLGNTVIPISALQWELARSDEVQLSLPIICCHTGQDIGSCGITILPYLEDILDLSSRKGKQQRVLVVDNVQCKRWISDVQSIHCQIGLPDDLSYCDHAMSSRPVDLSKHSLSSMSLREVIILKNQKKPNANYAVLKFFGVADPTFLNSISQLDAEREAALGHRKHRLIDKTKFAITRPHMVASYLEVLELNTEGEYEPSALDANCVFGLHQGVQRRLRIRMFHNSSEALDSFSITDIEIMTISIVKSDGEVVLDTDEIIPVKLVDSLETIQEADGTMSSIATCSWSSESPIFLRRTEEENLIQITLRFRAKFSTKSDAALFVCENIRLKIQGRHKRTSSSYLPWYFTSSPRTHRSDYFVLQLKPSLTCNQDQLWALDTCFDGLQGEELLMGWQPRTPVLISDIMTSRRRQEKLADVELTKAYLKLHGFPICASLDSCQSISLLRDCVTTWKESYTQAKVNDYRFTAKIGPDGELPSPPTAHYEASAKHLPSVKVITRRGPAQWLLDASTSNWADRWLVLTRPYLRAYSDSSESFEIGAIAIGDASIKESPEIEAILGVQHVLTIFGTSNSTVIRFGNETECKGWLAVLRVH